MTKQEQNLERLNQTVKEHKPFIVFDVETTGIMNGNDNRITQMAMAAYEYNSDNSRYELQDQIFMLAKADPAVLDNITRREQPTPENAAVLLTEEFLYAVSSTVNKTQEYIQEKLDEKEQFEKELEKPDITKKEKKSLEGKIATRDKKVFTKVTNTPYWKFRDDVTQGNDEAIINSPECEEYISVNMERKLQELENGYKLKDVLKSQGINKNAWVQSGEGLTTAELQLGYSEFLNKYLKPETSILTNGTHYASHYLEKEAISFPEKTTIINLTSASSKGAKWTSSIDEFASNYSLRTGNDIKTFDALTKALCWAEIACTMTENKIAHNSTHSLSQFIKNKALLNDENPVMSIQRAETSKWNCIENPCFVQEDYIYDALQYVDFGNDRRYVDLDKLFEINEDFKITLEGEKEPIKDWNELETKIKSLNATISDVLLDMIKAKYIEIEQKAINMEMRQTEYEENYYMANGYDDYGVPDDMEDDIEGKTEFVEDVEETTEETEQAEEAEQAEETKQADKEHIVCESENDFSIYFGNSAKTGIVLFDDPNELLAFTSVLKEYPDDFDDSLRTRLQNCEFVSVNKIDEFSVKQAAERYNVEDKNIWVAVSDKENNTYNFSKIKNMFPNSHRLIPPDECKNWSELLSMERQEITSIQTAAEITPPVLKTNDPTDLQKMLSQKLENFDARLAIVNEHKEKAVQSYESAFSQAIEKINKEMPNIVDFIYETEKKMGKDVENSYIYIKVDFEHKSYSTVERIELKPRNSRDDSSHKMRFKLNDHIDYLASTVDYTTEGIDANVPCAKTLVENYEPLKNNIISHMVQKFDEFIKKSYEEVDTIKCRTQDINNYLDDFDDRQ